MRGDKLEVTTMLSTLIRKRSFDVPCVIEVSHRFEGLGAHVSLPEGIDVRPGDRVRVHGKPIYVPYGEVLTEERTATVTRAPWWERLWFEATGDVDCLELIDVSFTDTRRK